jgi:hypothetical protein
VTARQNLCPNPALKVSNSGWAGSSTPTRSTGLTGLPRTTGAHYSINGYASTPACAASAGVTYTASLYFQNNTSTPLGSKTVYFVWKKPGDDFGTTKTVSLPTGVTRIDFTATSPAGTTGFYLLVDSFDASIGGGCDLTAVLFEQVGALDSYFDGDTSGASWDGTNGLSTSTLAGGFTQALPVALDASSAVALGRRKVRALPTGLDTSSAVALGRRRVRALPIAAELDSARELGGAVTVESGGSGFRRVQSSNVGRHVQATPKGRAA